MVCTGLLVIVVLLGFQLPCAVLANSTIYYFTTYRLGRKFDGIGDISGGATSPLLVNYPEKQRSEILDYLFQPNFGASLQILKVEIGGDAQSSDGTELSHMHYPWDENYQRGYEWWLMAEAKKRNPNIRLYGLPYSYPGWLGPNGTNPSTRPTVTADYVARWISGAKTHHNLTIDFIGLWNERNMTTEYVKTLRKTLDSRGLFHTQIVAPDTKRSGTTIITDIQNDPEFAAAVGIVGTHFPGTAAPAKAVNLGKPLWSASDFGTFNDDTGGGCWARTVNRNYAVGHMSATISWNVIASYYNPLPFFRQGLMTAVEPWSGNYVVETPIWISAHTTQFTEVGWTYLQHGEGVGLLAGGGSYVALLSPDARDITIIIETMSRDHSICMRSPLPSYAVVPQNITLRIAGDIAGELYQLHMWYSKLGFNGQPSSLFENLPPLPVQHGQASLSLGVDEIYTLTTLTRGQKGQHPRPPPSQPFPLRYSDDFENVPIGYEAPNLSQQTGAFEVVYSGDVDHKKVVRQMVLDMPVAWCVADTVGKAVTLVGDSDWTDVHTELDASLGKVNGTDGVFLAARFRNAGCDTINAVGVFFFLFPRNHSYAVYYDIVAQKLLTKGQLPHKISTEWNRLSLTIKGTQVLGGVNGQLVFNVTAPSIGDRGFVAFGTSTYGVADFDNFVISASATGQRKKQV